MTTRDGATLRKLKGVFIFINGIIAIKFFGEITMQSAFIVAKKGI
jgi:hypothetical protein